MEWTVSMGSEEDQQQANGIMTEFMDPMDFINDDQFTDAMWTTDSHEDSTTLQGELNMNNFVDPVDLHVARGEQQLRQTLLPSSESPISNSDGSSPPSSRKHSRNASFENSKIAGFSIPQNGESYPGNSDVEVMASLFDIAGASASTPEFQQAAKAPVERAMRDAKAQNFVTPSKVSKSSQRLAALGNKRRRASKQVENTRPGGFFLGGSREVSPLQTHNAFPSQPPSIGWNSSAPTSLDGTFGDFGINSPSPMQSNPWSPESSGNTNGATPESHSALPSTGSKSFQKKPEMFIDRITSKSRVETQIMIHMAISPLPPRIKKVHLQRYTISRPKLFAKDYQKQEDTLELHTMVVCCSALEVPGSTERAFHRALTLSEEMLEPSLKKETSSSDSSDNNSTEGAEADNDSDYQPLEGHPIRICGQCMNRERKRNERKKVKKAEEEADWQKDEAKRIVIFNTAEVKDWKEVSENGLAEPCPPQKGMWPAPRSGRVDLPMRITCYCRHHQERVGFQVIFTLKDHLGEVVCQGISAPVLITDDHKANPPERPPVCPYPNQNGYATPSLQPPYPPQQYGAPGSLPSPSFHKTSHSTNDLQGLRPTWPPTNNYGAPLQIQTSAPPASQQTSATMTPHASRPASPTFQQGPNAKKRKGSAGRVPRELHMTSVEQRNYNGNTYTTAPSSAVTSPYPQGMHFPPPNDAPQASNPYPSPYSAGLPTQNDVFGTHNRSQSMEDVAMRTFPQSAQASRPMTPHNAPPPMTFQQPHPPQVLSNQMYGLPAGYDPQNPPIINKITPAQGSKSGGYEVSCIGANYWQGIEVC